MPKDMPHIFLGWLQAALGNSKNSESLAFDVQRRDDVKTSAENSVQAANGTIRKFSMS